MKQQLQQYTTMNTGGDWSIKLLFFDYCWFSHKATLWKIINHKSKN